VRDAGKWPPRGADRVQRVEVAALWATSGERERNGRLGQRHRRCRASGVDRRSGSSGVACGGHGYRAECASMVFVFFLFDVDERHERCHAR
jgi:hypothetical protein